ncbi:DUF4352 domain-containing protein [Nonomuraea sp. NPDC046570]|uniref:DUF4352 domain-containing protein n=1 Tax=Nonomuraea sp. NPDC046570 TaxID=3155255 RepID=UPI0033FEA06F
MLLILAVVFVVLVGGCAALVVSLAGGGDRTTTANADRDPGGAKPGDKPKKEKPEAPGIGSVVKDGEFSFKVTKLERKARVGGDFLNKDAQGVFLLVYVTVKNIGDEQQAFSSSAQKLYAKGKEYEASAEAAIYLENSKSLYEEINPGNSVKGIVLFDVPKTLKPDSIELHDSLFSDGVRVDLAGAGS